MTREVTYTPAAVKALRRMGNVEARRIVNKVRQYADGPTALANNVTELKGSEFKRLRVGEYRVVFTEDSVVVTVVKVGHRSKIYE